MSVSIDQDLVDHVATLSRLSLDAEEAHAMTTHIRKIVDLVSLLDELDTQQTSPYISTPTATDELRADQLQPSLPVNHALANAPERSDPISPDGIAAFRVPPVLE